MELSEVKKPKSYSVKEVCGFMGISMPTLYRMIKDGKIKPINIAKSGKKGLVAFRAEDIQAYYDSIPNSTKGLKSVHKQDI